MNMASFDRHTRLISSGIYHLHSSRGGQYFITNLLTGRIFGLDEIPYRIFIMLKQAHAVNDVISAFPEADEASVISLLEYLISQELVYDEANPADETFQINNQEETFFNLPKFYFNAKGNRIVLAGIPFGRGNTISSATNNAPSVLRKYTSANKLDLTRGENFNNLEKVLSVDADFSLLFTALRNNQVKDAGNLFTYANEHTDHYHGKITRLAAQLFGAGQQALFVGGDHSITFPILKAADNFFKKIIVIHFDAHTDTYENPLDIVFRGKASNHHGNFALLSQELKNISGIWQFGIRGLSNIGMEPATGKQKIFYIKETRKLLDKMDLIFPEDACYYVTFDIDVLSPEYAPATATPVPNGLSFHESFLLLKEILKGKRLIGMDFVEFNYEKDMNGISAQLSVEMLILFMNFLCQSKNEV
jgi:agmatinase